MRYTQPVDQTLYVGFRFGGNEWDVSPNGLSLAVTCNGNDTGLRVVKIDGVYHVKGYEALFNRIEDVLESIAHSPFYYGLNSL